MNLHNTALGEAAGAGGISCPSHAFARFSYELSAIIAPRSSDDVCRTPSVLSWRKRQSARVDEAGGKNQNLRAPRSCSSTRQVGFRPHGCQQSSSPGDWDRLLARFYPLSYCAGSYRHRFTGDHDLSDAAISLHIGSHN